MEVEVRVCVLVCVKGGFFMLMNISAAATQSLYTKPAEFTAKTWPVSCRSPSVPLELLPSERPHTPAGHRWWSWWNTRSYSSINRNGLQAMMKCHMDFFRRKIQKNYKLLLEPLRDVTHDLSVLINWSTYWSELNKLYVIVPKWIGLKIYERFLQRTNASSINQVNYTLIKLDLKNHQEEIMDGIRIYLFLFMYGPKWFN